METEQKRMGKSEVQKNGIRESEIRTDELTGLYCGNTFYCEVEKYLSRAEGEYCLIAIDLEHFRLFNKLYGRDEGDRLLVKLAEMLREFSEKKGGIVGYLGGDDFCVLMENDSGLIKKFRRGITEEVRGWTSMVGFLPAFGICPIEDKTVPAITLYDRATVALSHVIGNYARRYCVYSQDMEDKVEREIRLLTEIQEGLRKEEFTFFIQPQCDISTGKIVGGESLVRWQHSTKGLISPGVFVPILERNGFIATLDRYVWRKVCQWLRSCLDRGFNPVPISINVSRIDIFSMDVPAYLSELLSEYNLSAKLLKVEITESAYAESNDKIIRTVKQLRDEDFLVMMDDFGSGYSSLNMLKSVAVDVLKIDMRFLEIDENEQEKGIGILESVVNMARQMNMPIVVEGVETQKQENFLLKMGCRYMQGYYYYKPMPIEDFEQLLSDGRNLDLNGIWCRQIESVHLREFLDQNLFNDTMINHILGAAAFYDMYENTIEITRVNMQYLELAGVSSKEEESFRRKFWNHVRDDDRQLLFSIFAQAYDNAAGGSQGYIHYLRTDGTVLWVLIRIYFLKERNGHKIFYGSLTDLTALQDKKRQESIMENALEEMSEKQLNRMEQNFGNLPWGYGLGRVCLDGQGSVRDYDIVYANREMSRLCGGDKGRLRYLLQKLFDDKQEEMYDKIYRAAYLGEVVEQYVYSALSCRYIWITFYQYQYGYAGCILRDDTRSYIYGTILESVLLSYRGVYFIHLQDNYCRIITAG